MPCFHSGPKSRRYVISIGGGNRNPGIDGQPAAAGVVSVPSTIFGYRLGGGETLSTTQASIAPSNARMIGARFSGLNGTAVPSRGAGGQAPTKCGPDATA